ncbi:AraC family transcriptional regulator [Mucilaginibacter sp. JRF]|uniref:AraC family transcriptional regulator n=1 Tax=Mucilaginibacter sp. JRF TaxID=2780088 RepID=UPI001881502D|nr:AraC family transcriptional regulator [Mucilaginibacter sp. JRF]MBE9583213.1 AraC family transcriptional regulator [Mucilaginibacter sp. JRF]
MTTAADQTRKVKEGFLGQKMIVLPPNIKKLVVGNTLTQGFYLTAIGYYPRAIYHDRERKTGSGEYILLYCTDGEGFVYINNETYTLKPNTYIIIPKHVGHRYKSSNTNPWSIYWVHFSGSNAEAMFERSLINGQLGVHAIPYDQERIKLFEQLCLILEHSFLEPELEVVNINLMQFIASLVYYKQINPVVYDNDSVSVSIAFMKKNLSQKFRIEDLAAHLGLSVSHYSRVFRHKTGSSPINYFNLLKIHDSCQYLYFTDRSIKEISVDLGFDDQYYFSRLFTKLIGMSPLNYRRKHRNHTG